jgi:hypothetical protein
MWRGRFNFMALNFYFFPFLHRPLTSGARYLEEKEMKKNTFARKKMKINIKLEKFFDCICSSLHT